MSNNDELQKSWSPSLRIISQMVQEQLGVLSTTEERLCFLQELEIFSKSFRVGFLDGLKNSGTAGVT